ncbi:MAG TPA: hypothetical protein VGK53_06620 [Propionicimonas sp.]
MTWIRRLAAPAAGILLTAFAVNFAPTTANAVTSGTLSVAPSAGAVTTLEGSQLSGQTVVDIKVPTILPISVGLQLRSANDGAGYRTKVRFAANGTMTVSLSRVAGSVETAFGSPVNTGVTVKPGDTVRLEGLVAGLNPVTTYVRASKVGAATPTWQLAARDYTASRITTEGAIRLWGYLSGTASSATKVAFSNVNTVFVTADSVASYPVKGWVSIGTPTTTTVQTPAPAPTTSTSSTDKPSATTTGVRAGSTLTRHDGDIIVTKDGTVLSNLDIHGFVTVRAKNVTITNSIVRGGKATGVATGLITDYGYAGLVISDVRVVPEFPSVWFDGIKGSDFTARRVHVTGGVDSVKIHGSNVTIEDSLLEDTTYYASDPQQGGTPTHNDNVQILYGQNLRITGNTIRGATNFAILGAASRGNTNLVLANNWLDGGHCTVKLQILNGWAETASVTGNKFGPNRAVSSCAFTSYPAVKLTQYSNTFEIGGATVTPLVLVS